MGDASSPIVDFAKCILKLLHTFAQLGSHEHSTHRLLHDPDPNLTQRLALEYRRWSCAICGIEPREQVCLGLYPLLLRLLTILLRLLQRLHRFLSRFDSTTKSGPRLVYLLSQGLSLLHRRLLLQQLVFQDEDTCFGHPKWFCLCQMLPGSVRAWAAPFGLFTG